MPTYIGGFYIDAAVREEHTLQNEITAHPVPEGADITEHIRRKPSPIRIEGVVSDTPIGDVALLRSDTVLPSREALEHLERIFAAKEPVTVVTGLKTYTDMLPEQLTIPRDSSTGEALAFSLQLVPAVFAQVGRVQVEVADPRGKSRVNRGNKATKAAETPPARRVSVLKQALGGVGVDTGAFARGD